jgi:hypothetical protein
MGPAAAVYARLGHDPAMPMVLAPIDVPYERLADWAKTNRVTRLWVFPAPTAPSEEPAGFVAADSRPIDVSGAAVYSLRQP